MSYRISGTNRSDIRRRSEERRPYRDWSVDLPMRECKHWAGKLKGICVKTQQRYDEIDYKKVCMMAKDSKQKPLECPDFE